MRKLSSIDEALRYAHMLRRAFQCVVAALSLAGAACGHDGSPKPGWGAAQLIGGGTDAEHIGVSGMAPQIAMNASGTALALWQWRPDASSTAGTIWVDRYDPSSGWGAAEAVADGSDPVLAIDAAGEALLVWASEAQPPRSLQWRRFTRASGWSAASPVPIADAGAFALAMTPAGEALLVWTSSSDVWASSFSATGVWGSPVHVSASLGPGNLSSPQVVLDAVGDAAVVWIDWQAAWPFGHASLRGTHFVVGSGWSDVQTFGGGHQVLATRLVGDPAGNAAIVWVPVSVVAGPPSCNRLTIADGWHVRESIGSLGMSALPQPGMGPNGTVVAILSEPGATAGASSALTALRFDPSTSWSAPVSLTLGVSQSVSAVDLDVDSSGRALVVWSQQGNATRGTVWAAELSADLHWGTPAPLHGAQPALPSCGIELGDGGSYSPTVRLDASGRGLAVWGEFDCERQSIWASRFFPR